MSVTVYGASDDLIEIEGDIREEFGVYGADEDEGTVLAFSDGTVLRVRYTQGIWRITTITHHGLSKIVKDEAPEDDDDNYSDRVKISADIEWVVKGDQFVRVI